MTTLAPKRLFLVATGSWFFAFGMQSVLFAWLVTIVLREDAEWVGWAQTAVLAPGLGLILLAGVLADRLGADRQALVAQLVATLAPWILIFAVENGALSYSVMVVYALVLGTAQAFVTPARDGLLNAVAGGSIQRTVMMASLVQFGFQIMGYWIAGYADAVGATTMLILQSAALLVGVISYEALRRADVAVRSENQTSVMAGVMEGARTIAVSPVMRVVVLQNLAMAIFFMGCFVVNFPLVVREVFNGSSADLAILNSVNSAGLVATILIMLRVGYVRQPGRALLLFQILGSIALLASGFMQNFALFVTAIFVWGLCGGIAIPMSRTLMQELAPEAQRSRVMSFYAFSFMGAGPLGTVFNGYLSAVVGPQTAIVICGTAMLVVAVVMSLVSSLWSERFSPA